MRIIAAILLIAGTVAATLGAGTLDEPVWAVTIPGIASLLVGAVLWRVVDYLAGESVEAVHANAQSVRDDLTHVRDVTIALEQGTPGLPLGDIVDQLSELERAELANLSETLPSLAARFGSAAFAELLSAYSSSERLLRRAWSAAADGHAPEAASSLSEARVELDQTLALLTQAMERQPPPLDPPSQASTAAP